MRERQNAIGYSRTDEGEVFMQVARMSEAESRAWLALISTAELLPVALDAQLQRDAGLTHYEFMVLSVLQRHKTMRLSELAAATNAALPRASKVISRLQARAFVERIASQTDRRAVSIRLIQAGRKALVHALPGHLETVRALVLDRLDPAQITAIADALSPVVAALDPHGAFHPQEQ